MPWRARRSVISWANRPVGVPSCPAPPRPAAPPCAAPPRPARGMFELWIVKYWSPIHDCLKHLFSLLNRLSISKLLLYFTVKNSDIARAGRGRAAHGRAAGQSETGRSAQKTNNLISLQGIEDNCPERLSGITNNRKPRPPMKEHNEQFTIDRWSAYSQCIRETTSDLRSWLLTNVLSPMCLCKPFSYKVPPKFVFIKFR